MPQAAFLSVVFMMAFVMLFVQMRSRHRQESFSSITGLSLFHCPEQKVLSPRERARRLYAMGELAAAAELIAETFPVV